MNTGPQGIALMHHYEQCRLEAYPDPGTGGEPWTIGWGDTGGWKRGDRITQERADAMFAERLAREFEPGVLEALTRAPAQCQFDAFVSLAYNIGVGAFEESSAARKFNAGDEVGAQRAITLWNKAGGRVMKGLQRRREAERLVFNGVLAADAVKLAEAKYP